MKYLLLIFLLVAFITIFAQEKKDTGLITQKDLIGTWQRDSNIIGNGLNQNFEFYHNGTFVLNLGDDGDDARSIIKLKGKYRMVDDKLYFTIMSRTVIDGEIEIGDKGVTLCIFQFGENAKVKEIQEANPKELVDPCYITLIKHSKIKLNNEIYCKIK